MLYFFVLVHSFVRVLSIEDVYDTTQLLCNHPTNHGKLSFQFLVFTSK